MGLSKALKPGAILILAALLWSPPGIAYAGPALFARRPHRLLQRAHRTHPLPRDLCRLIGLEQHLRCASGSYHFNIA
jgi:hypothetical protein